MTEQNSKPAVEVPKDPDIKQLESQPRLEDLFGQFKTVSSAPTSVPKTVFDQIQFHKNGGTQNLYFYDATNGAWRYVALT